MKLNQLNPIAIAVATVLAVGAFALNPLAWLTARENPSGRQDATLPEQKSDSGKSKTSVDSAPDERKELEADSQQLSEDSADASSSSDSPAQQIATGRQWVRESHAFLKRHAIESDVRQRGYLFDKEVLSTGSYLQGGENRNCRMDLEIQTTHLHLKLRMVNDGVYFFRQLVEQTADIDEVDSAAEASAVPIPGVEAEREFLNRIERINLRQINTEFLRDKAWPGHWLAYGGLALFMEQFQRCFRITEVTTRLVRQQKFVVVRGAWKPEKLALLIPQQRQSILGDNSLNWKEIPQQIPLEIEIYFHPADELKGFPFRIVYYRPENQALEGLKQVPILVTEFSNTRTIDAPENRRFQFNADEKEVHDVTEEFIQTLRH